ncbi:EAL domain-containing protein [Nordella sp. HKS 07]|uniref:putative bifunctional diguanylate cyclase/phosphodiesterase n=1 Tax=Nordella sp. HKS 07 TaxID=2712222 RepID=UPI0013E1C863|nr:EAL domain-containing protein [Nordella sp. HKS 07]QIG51546.1 EAL domain-containing protein [Nordella sp. HKS 07]
MSRIRNFILKHRVSLRDLGMLAAVIAVITYIAFEIDIFATATGASEHERRIDLNEALLIGGILAFGLLIFAMRRYFDQKREMARRIAAEARAREFAYQDPLTGLPNRRQFEEALRTAVASPPAAGLSHAVMLLDLNSFKQINDTYGHGVGDEVLLHVAGRLLRAVREGDLVARLGGDEFIILAQHLLGAEAAASIALRIIHVLSEPIGTGRSRHQISAGIGIALLPGDALSGDEALRKADVALYRAKAEKRSAYRFFEEEMDQLMRERAQMEDELRRALEAGRVRPRFRPSFDLENGAVTGFEAVPSLIREDGEEVPPERFLSIAEEAGLIHAIATRILELACSAARHWPEGVSLAIDVLPAQLRDRDLGDTILKMIAKAEIAPARVELDVAESLIVKDLEAAKTALEPLREAGVRIVLDNFGTGYSNLYHIREFGFDKVKIDRRFVANMDQKDAARMVRALAGLVHGLGLAVSADGVAGATAKPLLIASGIHEGQTSASLVTAEGTREFFKTL